MRLASGVSRTRSPRFCAGVVCRPECSSCASRLSTHCRALRCASKAPTLYTSSRVPSSSPAHSVVVFHKVVLIDGCDCWCSEAVHASAVGLDGSLGTAGSPQKRSIGFAAHLEQYQSCAINSATLNSCQAFTWHIPHNKIWLSYINDMVREMMHDGSRQQKLSDDDLHVVLLNRLCQNRCSVFRAKNGYPLRKINYCLQH